MTRYQGPDGRPPAPPPRDAAADRSREDAASARPTPAPPPATASSGGTRSAAGSTYGDWRPKDRQPIDGEPGTGADDRQGDGASVLSGPTTPAGAGPGAGPGTDPAPGDLPSTGNAAHRRGSGVAGTGLDKGRDAADERKPAG